MTKNALLKVAEIASDGLGNVAKSVSKKTGLPIDALKHLDLDLKDFGKLGKKGRKYIRKHPAQAVLLGIGLGYFLGRTMGEEPISTTLEGLIPDFLRGKDEAKEPAKKTGT